MPANRAVAATATQDEAPLRKVVTIGRDPNGVARPQNVDAAGNTLVKNAAPAAAVTLSIANGASLSPALDLGEERLHRIALPAAWTAAAITFQASHDGVTYYDLYTAAAEVSLTVAASRVITVDPTVFCGIRYLKVRSGTSGVPVNQGAQRDLVIVTIPR